MLVGLKKLLYMRVGAGREPHQNFYPEPEPHQTNSALQHSFLLNIILNYGKNGVIDFPPTKINIEIYREVP
jgi:hypothetical protein